MDKDFALDSLRMGPAVYNGNHNALTQGDTELRGSSGARLSRSVSFLQLGLSPPRIFILLINISLLHHDGPCACRTISIPVRSYSKGYGFMIR